MITQLRIGLDAVRGTGRVPRSKSAAIEWLRRQGVPCEREKGRGGTRFVIDIALLPKPERCAWIKRQIDEAGFDQGEYDDAAHEEFLTRPTSIRSEAERRAAILRFVASRKRLGISWSDLAHEGRNAFPDFPSKPTRLRWEQAVENVDPINWAPALAPGYRGRNATAAMDEAAWRLFMSLIARAAPTWPLRSVYRDVRDIAAKRGWAWPSCSTVFRRWADLSEAERLVARHGVEEAERIMRMPALRRKPDEALSWVSLDGRMLDVWADWGDGKPRRPIMLILVDVASGMTLDFTLCKTENAVDTMRLIRRVCRQYGIFDRLYPDNGSAFASHIVAGGDVKKWRKRATDRVQPPGICHHLGIKLTFALPKNAQAKIAERKFADYSRSIDDRPEFQRAHTTGRGSSSAASSPAPRTSPDDHQRRCTRPRL